MATRDNSTTYTANLDQHIKRVTDPDIQSSVIEIMGTNVSTNYISCPIDPKKTLTIKLPFLIMIIKNVSTIFLLKLYLTHFAVH